MASLIHKAVSDSPRRTQLRAREVGAIGSHSVERSLQTFQLEGEVEDVNVRNCRDIRQKHFSGVRICQQQHVCATSSDSFPREGSIERAPVTDTAACAPLRTAAMARAAANTCSARICQVASRVPGSGNTASPFEDSKKVCRLMYLHGYVANGQLRDGPLRTRVYNKMSEA